MALSDQEHRAMADEMAQLVSEKDALKAVRKTTNADFREQMAGIDKRLLELAEAMSKGEKA
jgi:hypothetical protein